MIGKKKKKTQRGRILYDESISINVFNLHRTRRATKIVWKIETKVALERENEASFKHINQKNDKKSIMRGKYGTVQRENKAIQKLHFWEFASAKVTKSARKSQLHEKEMNPK